MRWNRTLAVSAVAISLLLSSQPLYAVMGDGVGYIRSASEYALTESVMAEVKSVVQERTPDGTRLGAVVRLANVGKRLVGVPDYEVRLHAADGVEYTLPASAANPGSIQPKETVELHYMLMVDTAASLTLMELSWVDADLDVYPKREAVKLTVPITGKVWRGLTDSLSTWRTVPWGESFEIPELAGGIHFTPLGSHRQISANGFVTVLALHAHNRSDREVSVPELLLDAKQNQKVFKGRRIGKGMIVLAPGSSAKLYFAIPHEADKELDRIAVLTEASFSAPNRKPIEYTLGWLELLAPKDRADVSSAYPLYKLREPIRLGEVDRLVPPVVELSVMELKAFDNPGKSYQAVKAAFKLFNKGDQPLPVSAFRAELVSRDGRSYSGSRIGAQGETLLPQFGYTLSYTFVVPAEENVQQLGLRLLDVQSAEPYSFPAVRLRSEVESGGTDGPFQLYPYRIAIRSWLLQTTMNSSTFSVQFRAKLNIEVEQEDKVLTDQGLSKLKLELVDGTGRVVGIQRLSLSGDDRITDGELQVKLGESDSFGGGYRLHVYESLDTPFGEAVRLIQTLQ